jgi:hypothetical protein
MQIIIYNKSKKYRNLIDHLKKYGNYLNMALLFEALKKDRKFKILCKRLNCMPCMTFNDTHIKILDSTYGYLYFTLI